MRTKERNQGNLCMDASVRVFLVRAPLVFYSILFNSIQSVSTFRINIYIILTFEYVNEYKSRLSITRNAAVIPRIFSARS